MAVGVKAFTIFGEIALPGIPESIRQLGQFERSGQQAASKLLGISGTALTVAGGLTAVVTGLSLAGKAALDFSDTMERGLRKTAAAIPHGADSMDFLRRSALRIAREIPLAMDAITEGLAETARRGAGSAAETVMQFEAASKVAIATTADLAQTVGTLDAAIDAFGLKAADAAHVADLFVAASMSGVQIDELGPILARVGAQAQAAGLNIDETVKAIIALVESGIPARQVGQVFVQALGGVRDGATDADGAVGKLPISLKVVDGQAVLTGAALDKLDEAQRAVAESAGLARRQAQAMSQDGRSQWQLLKNDLAPAWERLGRAIGKVRDAGLEYLRFQVAMRSSPPDMTGQGPGVVRHISPMGPGLSARFDRGFDSGGLGGGPSRRARIALEDLRIEVEAGRRTKEALVARLREEINAVGLATDKRREMLKELYGLENELIADHNRRVEEGLAEDMADFKEAAAERRAIQQAQLAYDLRVGNISSDERLAQLNAELVAWDTTAARKIEIQNEIFDLTTQQTDEMIALANQLAETNVKAARETLVAWMKTLAQQGRLTQATADQVDAALSGLIKQAGKSGRGTAGDFGKDIGAAMVTGIVQGAFEKGDFMERMFTELIKTAIIKVILTVLKIASPSRVMMDIGGKTIEGLALGMLGQQRNLAASFERTLSPVLAGPGGMTFSGAAPMGMPRLGLDVSKMPPPRDPLSMARDGLWLRFLSESNLEAERNGARAMR